MNECITSVDLNFSNGGGGHTATVTSIVGAQSAQTSEESLGEIAGDVGEKSSFSDTRIDSLMSRFVETETTTSADPTKKTIVRKYIDSTALKLSSLIVLVRGINAPPRGEGEFEDSVPFFSEVKGTAVPSFGGAAPIEGEEGAPVIIAGKIYNMESRNLLDGDATSVNLIYQGKQLQENLSLMEGSVNQEYKNNPDPSKYDLKFGYTLNEFKQILDLAGIEHEGLDPDHGDDVLFETSGPLMGVVGSVAGYFGFYHYIDPTSGKLKFINSALAAQLTITNPTETTDESVIAASFTKSGVTESIVNTYAGTAQNMDKSDMGSGDGGGKEEDVYKSYFKRVEIEQFDAFKNMKMSDNEIGAFFALFNQDQPPEMFDKFTYMLLVLSQRNIKQNGVLVDFPNDQILQFQNNQGALNRHVLRLAGNVDYVQAGGVDTDEIDTIHHPLYLPRPYNIELWAWGPEANQGQTQVIWSGSDARVKDNELNLAQKADKGHQFLRYNKQGDAGEGASAASYFALAYEKSDAQIKFEDIDEEKRLMPMPKPSQSDLYQFLKIYFQIAGGVYVSHGYSENRARRMGFENADNITVGGPFHKDDLIRNLPQLAQLHNFFQILGIGENATVGDLADLTNKEAKTVNDFHFVAIRNLPKLGMRAEQQRANQGQRAFGPDKPANFEPLGTRIEIYDKPTSFNGITRYVGGPLMDVEFQAIQGGRKRIFVKYLVDLIIKSIKAYKQSAKLLKNVKKGVDVPEQQDRSMVVGYVLHLEEIHPEDETDEDRDERIAGNDAAGNPARQERLDYHNRFDHRFYDIVAPKKGKLVRPTLSAASGNTKEMKVLRTMKGESQTASGSNLRTSSKTIYGLHIPVFTPTLSSVSISVGQGGIQTTIGESTVKILPPDQQFLIGLGVEAMVSTMTDSRFGAHQRNHFGL